MDLNNILSAHTGENKKILLVLLLAYANTTIKYNTKKCGNLPSNTKHLEDMLSEYKCALLGEPWSINCFELESVSNDPYIYLFTIKAELIKEFSDM